LISLSNKNIQGFKLTKDTCIGLERVYKIPIEKDIVIEVATCTSRDLGIVVPYSLSSLSLYTSVIKGTSRTFNPMPFHTHYLHYIEIKKDKLQPS